MAVNPNLQFAATPQERNARLAMANYGIPHETRVPVYPGQSFVTAHQGSFGTGPNWNIVISQPRQLPDYSGLIAQLAAKMPKPQMPTGGMGARMRGDANVAPKVQAQTQPQTPATPPPTVPVTPAEIPQQVYDIPEGESEIANWLPEVNGVVGGKMPIDRFSQVVGSGSLGDYASGVFVNDKFSPEKNYYSATPTADELLGLKNQLDRDRTTLPNGSWLFDPKNSTQQTYLVPKKPEEVSFNGLGTTPSANALPPTLGMTPFNYGQNGATIPPKIDINSPLDTSDPYVGGNYIDTVVGASSMGQRMAQDSQSNGQNPTSIQTPDPYYIVTDRNGRKYDLRDLQETNVFGIYINPATGETVEIVDR